MKKPMPKELAYILSQAKKSRLKIFKNFFDNNNKPEKYIITEYCLMSHNKPLEVKRLSDGMTFRLGDTIKRISLNGKKYRRFILTDIKDNPKPVGLTLFGYTVDDLGGVNIHNSKPFINSNTNPNIFKTIYK